MGGGKSDLLFGLAGTAHSKSLILRCESTQLQELILRSYEIFGERCRVNALTGTWRLPGVTGMTAAALIQHAIWEYLQILVSIDAVGGGAQAYDTCKELQAYRSMAINFSSKLPNTARTDVLCFVHLQAYANWTLRDLLDPGCGSALALPPVQELLSDLAAPHWKLSVQGIRIDAFCRQLVGQRGAACKGPSAQGLRRPVRCE